MPPASFTATIHALVGLVLGLAPVTAAIAQSYPQKPIKMISPFSAGSAPDALGRLVADRVSARLGQSITVENRPGAGTTIATKAAASADPDGYTLLQANAALIYGPAVYPNAGYDPLKSFAPVATLASWSHLLVAHPSVPARSLAELIAYMQSNPNQLGIGFTLGQPTQILAEIFKREAGAQISSVPYRQVSQLMADLLAGRIHAFFGAGSTLVSLVQQGKLKAIAYTGVSRYPALPYVPTVTEGGISQLMLNPSDWTGILAPAGTPSAAISALNAAINASLGSSDIAAGIAQQGGETMITQPGEFTAFLASEERKWPLLAKAAGMIPE